MLDFVSISTRTVNRGSAIEIYPKFIIKKSNDLMIRGSDFYAIWDEERGFWSTNEQDVVRLIDRELDKYMDENGEKFKLPVYIKHMWDADSGVIDTWHKYCQKQMRDNFHMLDERLVFANTKVDRSTYASKSLPYTLESGKCDAYDRLMSVLYLPEEREKIEWAIGSIVSGESTKLQKFVVLYGSGGTGKSTVLNIIQQLFEGYYSVFDAKALGSSNSAFALEPFRSNPLVAIQHDGDLSRIEDNTRLNSLVSHELMTVNEKFRSTYSNQFKCFLFMGTNKPVKITDAKSGLIRRLIDVTPSGNILNFDEYLQLTSKIKFELGAIAYRCLEVFKEDPHKYDSYIPTRMMGASNDFYNFVEDSYIVFKNEDGVSLATAWKRYKQYCEEAKVSRVYAQRVFKEELKNYFKEYKERYTLPDGSRIRSYYLHFLSKKFNHGDDEEEEADDDDEDHAEDVKINTEFLVLDQTTSILDDVLKDCQAQYATEDEKPILKWDDVKTTLKDLDTSKVHYVRPPENHIVIDFDLRDENGNKSLELNLREAAKWPETYAEISKSGQGVHLHYIYPGDTSKLQPIYSEHIEIKTFSGKSSLRRMLTLCNNKLVEIITAGLPIKGAKKIVDFVTFKSEKALRALIKKNLRKEIHPATKPSIDFIYKILEDAYASGKSYDVSDMRTPILSFAVKSTHNADYCVKMVSRMKFKSEAQFICDYSDVKADDPAVFYDVEVFPNLFLVNWKTQGPEKKVVRMINPNPNEIEDLVKFKLIGFNNRRYDNHMLYGCMLGKSNAELFDISQKIIAGDRNAFFGEAYNLSYTDVYDFCSKKQSLKKWEIELGIYHKELGLPWDQPVPEEKWIQVAEYCDNDVLATEAVFNACAGDFAARKILAKLAGGIVNDTTNTLTGKLIFGNDRNPQSQFNYRFLGDPVPESERATGVFCKDGVFRPIIGNPEYTVFDSFGKPHFPGYTFTIEKDGPHSIYRREEASEGGYVYAEPGIYINVVVLDIASMHPSSVIAEELFGKLYTKRFEDIKNARVAVKHQDWETAKTMLDGALTPYIVQLENGTADFTSKDLAQALKIVINSIYGLTSAKFQNLFKDPRNVDNIVAKRGALFMINLKHEVQERGFTVAHIKTDSIKIPNATPEIIQFVMDYGELYGYTFEHESTYERMCLINDAVYIARYMDENGQKGEWTATGTRFQVPYVFKTLFSHEDITFDDLCETKSVSTALYLDFNEKLPNVERLEKELVDRLNLVNKPNSPYASMTKEELVNEIENGHSYYFVGKVGRFCPIKSGYGGAVLCRETTDKWGNKKYTSPSGTQGYRWLESSMVEEMNKQDAIDLDYYNDLVNDAVAEIAEYGDPESFMAE